MSSEKSSSHRQLFAQLIRNKDTIWTFGEDQQDQRQAVANVWYVLYNCIIVRTIHTPASRTVDNTIAMTMLVYMILVTCSCLVNKAGLHHEAERTSGNVIFVFYAPGVYYVCSICIDSCAAYCSLLSGLCGVRLRILLLHVLLLLLFLYYIKLMIYSSMVYVHET